VPAPPGPRAPQREKRAVAGGGAAVVALAHGAGAA
jgi:hypothetical protein